MFDYETNADAIALALWEEDTGNGTGLDRDMWDSHMENCRAATANAYQDGMNVADWHATARALLHRATAQPA